MCPGAFLQRELGDHVIVSKVKFLRVKNCVCVLLLGCETKNGC